MIIFDHILIEGFGSYLKPFLYSLNRPGINVIQGKNGSGKSTIFSALTWCLFGQTLKGKSNVEPWEDIQPPKFRGTQVQLVLFLGKDTYVITRNKNFTLAPLNWKNNSGLFISKNARMQDQFRNKDDAQTEIVRILGMTCSLFKNSISFGQNLTRLLQESGPEQKKTFDEAFEVMFINKARDKASKVQKEQETEYQKVKTELDLTTEKINNYENQIQSKKEIQRERQGTMERIRNEIADCRRAESSAKDSQQSLEESRAKKQSYQRKVERLKELEDKEFKLDFGLTQAKAVMDDLVKKSHDIMVNLSKPNPQCITCGQDIQIASRDKYRKNQKVKLKEYQESIKLGVIKIKEVKTRLEKIQASKLKLQVYKDKLKRIEILLDSKKNSTRSLHEIKATRLELKKRLKEVNAKLSADLEVISELSRKHGRLQMKHRRLTIELAPLTQNIKLHTWLISDPLSNKGLKTFIFNSMLGLINKRLRYYGRYLGYIIEFHIDMESGNKNFQATVHSGDKIRPYNDLSGGQKQLVDICLAFSIHDVVTETKKVNILLMDEIFESLDIDNVELVSELISVKSQGISTHLISHQQSLQFARVVNTLQLELHKGITHPA